MLERARALAASRSASVMGAGCLNSCGTRWASAALEPVRAANRARRTRAALDMATARLPRPPLPCGPARRPVTSMSHMRLLVAALINLVLAVLAVLRVPARLLRQGSR